MNVSQQRRLWVVIAILFVFALVVIYRLVSFQVVREEELAELGKSMHYENVVARPARGIIYDRNLAVMAGNGSDYQVGISPPMVVAPEEIATALAPFLEERRATLLTQMNSEYPFELLAGRISPEVAATIRELPYDDVIQLDPLPRRIYPHDDLMCHILGYTDFSSTGGSGLEGYYQSELAGEAASALLNISPLTKQEGVIAREGADLVLTLDRTIQHVVEQHLQQAMDTYQAQSGTIIVMAPRTGAILAMANLPCFSPYKFFEAGEEILLNPSVSKQYEPGSVMKLITMSAALDSGTVTPQTTYYDSGVIVLGGHPLYNWDRSARGTVDMTGLLANSLNVGAATIASWMGPDTFYNYFQRFNFGRPMGIDVMAEAGGQLPLPGDELWTETNLGTNAFGQGMAVTPLQMVASVSALANDGYLMQPYLVQSIRKDGQIVEHEPTVISRPISEQTADVVTAMAVNAVRTEVFGAQVVGYTVAGKTGTAQIPEGGIYHPSDTIASFIGWLPADDPEIIVLIKLDRPKASPWGSTTAAPAFAELATDLVALLDIPPDDIRLQQEVVAAREP
ncbi:MAG: penicillin-binding protein 2 [Chloroflexota bacterium]|nr:MAG: penicillin-binding protein 2 [Chloroflexota bacterium]